MVSAPEFPRVRRFRRRWSAKPHREHAVSVDTARPDPRRQRRVRTGAFLVTADRLPANRRARCGNTEAAERFALVVGQPRTQAVSTPRIRAVPATPHLAASVLSRTPAPQPAGRRADPVVRTLCRSSAAFTRGALGGRASPTERPTPRSPCQPRPRQPAVPSTGPWPSAGFSRAVEPGDAVVPAPGRCDRLFGVHACSPPGGGGSRVNRTEGGSTVNAARAPAAPVHQHPVGKPVPRIELRLLGLGRRTGGGGHHEGQPG